MQFDHENPKDTIVSDISLGTTLDIPTAFSARHSSAHPLSGDKHPFKRTLLWKRMSAGEGLANEDLHVLWNYVRWILMQVGSYLEAKHAKGVSC